MFTWLGTKIPGVRRTNSYILVFICHLKRNANPASIHREFFTDIVSMSLKKKKNGSKGKSAKRNDSDQDRMLAEARKELINQATRLQELIEEENSISRGFCTQTDKLRSFKEIQQGELEVS